MLISRADSIGQVNDQLPDPDRIKDLLDGTLWREVTVVETTGSTNADLADRARQGDAEGVALISAEQTAGRGRLDRQWVSPARRSIAMSVLLRPLPEFPQWGWLSILAGMAVAEALGELSDDPGRVTLKWPNDVLIDGRKVCGILSERIEHPGGARAVVGMGINLTLTREELPVPTATSLALAGLPTDPDRIAAGVLNHFERLYLRWQRQGALRADYEARCASVGQQLTVHLDAERRVVGTGRGVDEYGRLQVATARGIETFAVGDVVHARID